MEMENTDSDWNLKTSSTAITLTSEEKLQDGKPVISPSSSRSDASHFIPPHNSGFISSSIIDASNKYVSLTSLPSDSKKSDCDTSNSDESRLIRDKGSEIQQHPEYNCEQQASNSTRKGNIQPTIPQLLLNKRSNEEDVQNQESCNSRTPPQIHQDVKVLLKEKRKSINKTKGDLAISFIPEDFKKQRCAAKLAADRKKAIEKLHKSRKEKLHKNLQLAEEEIVKMEAKQKSKSKKRSMKLKSQSTETNLSSQKHISTGCSTQQNFQNKTVSAQSTTKKVSDKSSTYDEIISTLQLLEKVPSSLSHFEDEQDIVGTLYEQEGSVADNVDFEHSSEQRKSQLQSILVYLDEVEKSEFDHSINSSIPTTVTYNPTQSSATFTQSCHTDVQVSMENASATVKDVTATIIAQRMELENKNKTITMLQKALNEQKELTLYHAKEMEKEEQRRLTLLKSEHEETVKRHQCFIDQLIEDKKSLNEHCEVLLKDLKDLDTNYKAKVASLEKQHAADIMKIKQVTAASDKLRMEKWQAEQTQRIKESTVKGLEPEIQKIISKSKMEMIKIKALHEAELSQADERANKKFLEQIEQLQEQYSVEREQACTQEREIARKRYEKLVEQEEVNFQQQRRKLYTELAQEKQKMADEVQRQRELFEVRLTEVKEKHIRMMEQNMKGHSRQIKEMTEQHNAELCTLQENVKEKCSTLEEFYSRKKQEDRKRMEHSLKKQLRQERDKEIELIIAKFEDEMSKAKEENEQTTKSRIRRMNEKCETEVREAEQSEKSTILKFNSLKTQVIELQGEVAKLQSALHLRDEEIERITHVSSKLSKERDQVTDIVRREFIDKIALLEKENKELKKEITELRSSSQIELEHVEKTKDLELKKVHEKIRQAMEKKERSLDILREQYEGTVKRADHLQMLLQRQRQELLKK